MVQTTDDTQKKVKDDHEPDGDLYESNTGTGPVVVTRGGQGSIRVTQGTQEASEVAFDRQNLWLEGEGFQEGVEVVINFDATDGGETNARVSKWTEDGKFRFQLPDFVRPATYRITAYVPQERVGDTANDTQREMKMVDQTVVTINPVSV